MALSLERIVELLGRTEAFARGSDEELRALAEGFEERDVSSGDCIVREKEPGDGMFLIVEGEFRALADGKEVGTLGSGNVFGEIAALTGGARMASIEAVTDGQILFISQDLFQKALRKSPGFMEAVCLSLAKYLD